MDLDKLKQWMEIAQKVQGNEFWNGVFEGEYDLPFSKESDFRDADHIKHSAPARNTSFPPVDIYQTKSDIWIIASIPGVRKEDLQLSMKEGRLSIQGTLSLPIHDASAIQSERKLGPFERIIALPEPVTSGTLSARYYNGILEIRYPRTNKEVEPIQIED